MKPVNSTNQKRLWHQIDWKQAVSQTRKLQNDIATAMNKGDLSTVYKLQRKLMCSFGARALAVRHVLINPGGKTAGIDGIVWDSPEKRWSAIQELGKISQKPTRYKRPFTKQFILPRMIDRRVQVLYILALYPTIGGRSDHKSINFNQEQHCHDVITSLCKLLDKPYSSRYILNFSIEQFVDHNILYEYLLEIIPMQDKHVLKQWLESTAFFEQNLEEIEIKASESTFIVPLLCNMALIGMEDYLLKHQTLVTKRRYKKVRFVQYLNHIVVVGPSWEALNEAKELIENFLEPRGLKMKSSTTKKTTIEEGFNFLGFNFRKMITRTKQKTRMDSEVLVVKPTTEAEVRIKSKIKRIVKPSKSLRQICKELNPTLKRWCKYYCISYHRQARIKAISHYLWRTIWQYARKRHPKTGRRELFLKYIQPHSKWKWTWVEDDVKLFNMNSVTIVQNRPKFKRLHPNLNSDRTDLENNRRTLEKTGI